MTIEADRKIISEFIGKTEGEIKATPVRIPDSQTILYYQLVWEALGNTPEEDERIIIGGEYPTREDAMTDVVKSQTKLKRDVSNKL